MKTEEEVRQKLENVLSENPDPSKWSKWLRTAIKILLLILSAIGGDLASISEIFKF